MSKMSICFLRNLKNIENFSYWKSQWKMKISLWSSGKNIEIFSYEKVNEKWKFRKNYKRFSYKKVWVCPGVICDFLVMHLFFEVPWDFWEASIVFRKEARYPRFYPIPSCGVCEHLCRCLPLVWTRPLGYKNLYLNRVYFAVFEDALEYKIIVDYWVLKKSVFSQNIEKISTKFIKYTNFHDRYYEKH